MRHERTDERRSEHDARGKRDRRGERGAALVEFAIGATVFLTVMFGVIEFGLLLWTHNALTDAARRGARYAVTHPQSQMSDVQNVVIYGDAVPATGAKPMVANLSPANVAVAYNSFSVGAGRVTVSIENYDYNFVVPLVGLKVRLPRYQTTLTGESAGYTPPPI
jgi:Flp pilus assembly protein TadG